MGKLIVYMQMTVGSFDGNVWREIEEQINLGLQIIKTWFTSKKRVMNINKTNFIT